jgi:hypothetical protein
MANKAFWRITEYELEKNNRFKKCLLKLESLAFVSPVEYFAKLEQSLALVNH